MRAPLSWIREFTPVDAPAAEIAEALDHLGLEVEAIDDPGREIEGVVVARVLDVVPHPNADKLRLCDVDFGAGQTRVVCGAPNVYPGMVAPFAPAGARLPGGFTLERRKIRGVVSDGMLCSARELGLGDDHEGILDLGGGPGASEGEGGGRVEVGGDLREALGLDDVVFEMAITPNRPDAMAIVGVARELAAHFGLPLDLPLAEPGEPTGAIGDVTVEVEAPGRCPRFVARVARVAMGPSPEWMQRRLRLAGMRPISNVVDVTNYVMLERCRPLHAFDLGRLAGRGIVVRLAREGEKMTTLDGIERTLTGEDLLICDAERSPQAIAGIMGGADSEVGDETAEILLESAYFEPHGIARSSKRLGLRSEASARFERGIDPNGTGTGADYAMRLLAEVAAAQVEPLTIDAYPLPVERARITLRTARVNTVLGTALGDGEVRSLLGPLGIECEGSGDDFVALAPTFRPDLEREIDLIEEVARRIGLHTITRTVPANPTKVGRLTPQQRDRRRAVDVLVGAGYCEAYTLPLLSVSDLERAGVAMGAVIEVENPLRHEESILRPRILPGLLRAAAYNAARGMADAALFEVGHVFGPPPDGALLPDERDHLAVVRAGWVRRRPHEADRPVRTADAVAVIEALAVEFGLADWHLAAGEWPGLHPRRCARVVVDGAEVGAVGEVALAVLDALALPGPVAAAEVDLDRLLDAARRERHYLPPSPFPPSSIDLAFVVEETVPAATLRDTLRTASGDLLEEVRLFDVFRSEALGPGRVSLAYTLRFRAADRTLTDDEVADLRRRCIDAVVTDHGATLRG